MLRLSLKVTHLLRSGPHFISRPFVKLFGCVGRGTFGLCEENISASCTKKDGKELIKLMNVSKC